MTSQIVLTNLLYFKDEVIVSLLTSLLNKSEAAVFWAYELHYSGFNDELFELFEKLYYYFFATLNPKFKKFLNRKIKEWRETENIQVINQIVSNLLIRPFNLDIFMLKHTSCSIKIPSSSTILSIKQWIEERKYATVAKYVLYSSSEQEFSEMNTIDAKSRLELLVHFIQKSTEEKGIKCGNNLYLDSEYIVPDIEENPVLYKILEKFATHRVNETEVLGAFELNRPKTYAEVVELWRENWLYYACASPVWLSRVDSHGGMLNNEKKTVEFKSEDEENFYNNFNLEPDEQKRETQEKIIPEISEVSTFEFYKRFNKGNGIYVINEKMLNKVKKFSL
jgi:hypothetical protein